MRSDLHCVSIRRLRLAALLAAATLSAAGCAHVSGGRQRAIATALDGVCGPVGTAARDTSCVVRSAQRLGRGYRVVIDRRPPAGRDRLSVLVRGGSIEVTPIDTSAHTP